MILVDTRTPDGSPIFINPAYIVFIGEKPENEGDTVKKTFLEIKDYGHVFVDEDLDKFTMRIRTTTK